MVISPERCRTPVVFFANGIGDTVLALPALRALAALFPGRLSLVCDRDVWPGLFCDLAPCCSQLWQE